MQFADGYDLGDPRCVLRAFDAVERNIVAHDVHKTAAPPKDRRVIAERGGSISAEHGVGLLKRDFLGFSRSADELKVMAGLKSVFDPNQIMNPGKLLA